MPVPTTKKGASGFDGNFVVFFSAGIVLFSSAYHEIIKTSHVARSTITFEMYRYIFVSDVLAPIGRLLPGQVLDKDEYIKGDTSLEQLQKLKPAFRKACPEMIGDLCCHSLQERLTGDIQ